MGKMGRPKRNQVDLSEESMVQLMQEVYNELTDERNRALRAFNQFSRDMDTNEDIALVGRITNDLLKIIDLTVEKKIRLIKIQGDILFKNNDKDNSKGSIKLTEEDKQIVQDYLKKTTVETKTYDE